MTTTAEVIPIKGFRRRAARRSAPATDGWAASRKETVDSLTELLAQAKRGRLIGLAYMVMQDNKGYVVVTAGECTTNPTFTRGALRALDDRLSKEIWE